MARRPGSCNGRSPSVSWVRSLGRSHRPGRRPSRRSRWRLAGPVRRPQSHRTEAPLLSGAMNLGLLHCAEAEHLAAPRSNRPGGRPIQEPLARRWGTSLRTGASIALELRSVASRAAHWRASPAIGGPSGATPSDPGDPEGARPPRSAPYALSGVRRASGAAARASRPPPRWRSPCR